MERRCGSTADTATTRRDPPRPLVPAAAPSLYIGWRYTGADRFPLVAAAVGAAAVERDCVADQQRQLGCTHGLRDRVQLRRWQATKPGSHPDQGHHSRRGRIGTPARITHRRTGEGRIPPGQPRPVVRASDHGEGKNLPDARTMPSGNWSPTPYDPAKQWTQTTIAGHRAFVAAHDVIVDSAGQASAAATN